MSHPQVHGVLLVDKPAGPTSHDVVDAIRRQFNLKKVGHCGTLDPAATGLLIIVLGRGTKLSERLMSDDKVYEGTMKFGESTDSYDADGQLVAGRAPPGLRDRVVRGEVPLPVLRAGELRAEVDSVFPLTEARAAFERVAGRGKRGKVVLEVGVD